MVTKLNKKSDKIEELKLRQNLKTQITTKKLKNQITTNLRNSNCDNSNSDSSDGSSYCDIFQ